LGWPEGQHYDRKLNPRARELNPRT